ncbi:trehalose-6-phosphate synthase [uncultured Psychrobacter sp.]|uniref:alpha,alpha-trehalose-phosphate synthase (UDP-forming) n=1 Tax=uncultured Psychrobacter sp. TaxID=259303 RepID=UPI002637EA8A|nr:trehalose-6-phosphate synthase [uncultured Psychrobacter sp.]
MSRLIVLSNRVKTPDNQPMAGGLAVALQDILQGNSVIWMGWNGDITESCNDGTDNEFSSNKNKASVDTERLLANTSLTYMTTAFTSEQYRQFYCGFANSVLWLLLHERPEFMNQAADDYQGYQEVNRLFAHKIKQVIEPDDVIWVHDYHFLSVAYHCRSLGITNRIGFFLHIPFAPLAFWQQLDQSAELIHHLAHYDVLGTQTEHDKANCLAVLQHYLNRRLLSNNPLTHVPKDILATKDSFISAYTPVVKELLIQLDIKPEHSLIVNAYPIGVNITKIQQQVGHLWSPSLSADKSNNLKTPIKPAAQQIIAVDRIDYSKGLLKRFSAYRSFLQQYPSYQTQLQLKQIACPSRLDLPAYQHLYDTVRVAIAKANQQLATSMGKTDSFDPKTYKTNRAMTDWQAIDYSEKVLDHKALMMLFLQSDVGWVNSLKDGMNLVAKEYIAAQNPDDPGVLLLSRYAGAAEQMQDAVIIDPLQPASIIQGLRVALTMPLGERQLRYQKLLQGLQRDDLQAWQQRFLDDLYKDNGQQTQSLSPEQSELPESQ